MTEVLKVDLACGDNKQAGFIGVDLHKTDSVDKVMDLTKKWGFEDGTVDEVFCSHYIEHVKDLIHFWNELYRILKVGGKATINCPFGGSNRAWQDPTHVRAIEVESFWYLSKEFRKVNKLEHYLFNKEVDFDFVISYVGIDPYWLNKSEEARNFALKHYRNVAADLSAVLIKKG